MNSPTLNYSRIKINFLITKSTTNRNSIKLLSSLLLSAGVVLKKSNNPGINKRITYSKILPLLNSVNPEKKLPRLENVTNFITKSNLLESSKDAYYNLFNFFLNIGLHKKNLFFLDTVGPMCRLVSVLN